MIYSISVLTYISVTLLTVISTIHFNGLLLLNYSSNIVVTVIDFSVTVPNTSSIYCILKYCTEYE